MNNREREFTLRQIFSEPFIGFILGLSDEKMRDETSLKDY